MLIATTDKETLDSLRCAMEIGVNAAFEIPREELALVDFLAATADEVESVFIPAYTCDRCHRASEAAETTVGIGGVLCESCAIETGQHVPFDGEEMFGSPPEAPHGP